MEKEGLSRAIDFLSENSLTIHTLVIDRHKQITKFISKKHPNIEHHYDVWHVSKGMLDYVHTKFSLRTCIHTYTYIRTYIYVHIYTHMYIIYRTEEEIDETGQIQDCNIINDWTKSITNHMYWYAASSPGNDCEQMVIRWKSLMDHICDNHEECYHDPLRGLQRHKKWFIPGKICNCIYAAIFLCTCIFISYV